VSPSMQGYQHKMKLAQATSKGICYGSGQNVGRMSLKDLLSQNTTGTSQYQQDTEIPSKYQVPIFQRRYCWTETQWQTLLMDAATSKSLHSLGRLTCTTTITTTTTTNTTTTAIQQPSAEEEKVATDDDTTIHNTTRTSQHRSIILDGQQRFTTITLLLAAIRDAMWKRQQKAIQKQKNHHHHQGQEDQQAITDIMIAEINQILFPDQDDFEAWLAAASGPQQQELKEGMTLSFAKLIPTYCDRWSYYSAILPQDASVSNRLDAASQTAFHRPLAAKKYYDGMLAMFSNGEIKNLLQSVYTKLTMLLFPIEFAGRTDGTEDLMVVYERLALRDATFCTPTRSEEYVTMSGPDMIRNALLGAFVDPTQALEFYQSYWLPMERMAAVTLTGKEQNDDQQQEAEEAEEEERNMASMMHAFLDQEHLEAEEEKMEEGTVGGRVYARFQLWQDLHETQSSLSAEDATRQQGESILTFAQGYFEP